MSNDFNALFNKLVRLAEAREKKSRRRQRSLQLGDTSAGRAATGGQSIESNSDSSTPDHRGSYAVREYRQNPGATKGRGPKGGVRK